MSLFKKKGKFLILDEIRDYKVPTEDLYSKGWFMVSQIDEKTNLKEIDKYFKIYENKKKFNAIYSKEVELKLIKFIKKQY